MLVAALPAGAATRRSPTLAPSNTVIDGPGAAIHGLSGMSVARDGTGGVIYLKDAGGVPHVFVSSLRNGAFQPPLQIDAGLPGASSQPVIAAGAGGLLVAAFVNGGTLYVDQTRGSSSPWATPPQMYTGGSNPAVSMTLLGKTYLAFTAPGGGGDDVRGAYYQAGQWTPPSAPLDANPGDNAGAGARRPAVMAADDGTGIVAWGENGHIFTRRILRGTPSIAVYQADPSSFGGWSEVSADDPVISSGGDSSYAAVAFREVTTSNGVHQTRVLVNRLHSYRYDGAHGVDGLTTPAQGNGDQPAVAVNEGGSGFATSEQSGSHNLFATTLGTNDVPGANQQVNSLPESSAPDAVPATAGSISNLIAWQQDGGSGSTSQIDLRYAPDGTDLGSEQIVSSPSLGPTDASRGLAAGGDTAGDAVVAWVQGTGGQTQIVAAQLFQPPGSLSLTSTPPYFRTPDPVLSWSAAGELWGSPQYVVKVDGTTVGTTTATSLRVPQALSQGHHSWQVTAYNRAGLTSSSRVGGLTVDSIPPFAKVTVTGVRRVGSLVHAYVSYSDARPGSGVASVQIKWGDGAKLTTLEHRFTHTYKRRGQFTLTVIVKDKAGNRRVATKHLKIAAKAKAKAKPKRHKKG
jgi:hypothetical protein